MSSRRPRATNAGWPDVHKFLRRAFTFAPVVQKLLRGAACLISLFFLLASSQASWAQIADLQVSKTGSAPTVAQGQNLIYTVTLNNAGPNNADNVQLVDVLPAGTTFVSASQNAGPAFILITPPVGGTGNVIATIPLMVSGATATFTIVVNVNAAPGALLVNTAQAITTTADPDGSNNTAVVFTLVVPPLADLSVAKTAPATVLQGQNIAYALTWSNAGPSDANNTQLVDVIPAGTTFVSISQNSGPAATLTTPPVGGIGTVTATLANFAAGATATFTLTVNVNAAAPPGSTVTNTATATSTTPDPALGNNSATAITTVTAPNATTTTVSSSQNPSTVGQSVTFTATVASGGGTPTGTVTFTIDGTPQPPIALAGGSASFTTSSLALGPHIITATYNGAPSFLPSTSPAFTQTVVAVATTTTALASSVNPSSVGQPVTYTATVTSSSGTPTGTVTFRDGASVLGTAALAAGVATFTTSSLTLGAHSITASYGGAATFAASTSPALTQTVQVPPDSVRLRALQLMITKIEAQASGAAFEGAVAGAIADGFDDSGGALITPTGNGVRFNFAGQPTDPGSSGKRYADQSGPMLQERAGAWRDDGLSARNQNMPSSMSSFAPTPSSAGSRVDDAFDALAKAPVTKAPSLAPAAPKVWRPWLDVRWTGWNTDFSAGDIRGGQVNAIAGVTRKLTPDLLVGVLGGYENFDYTSQTLNGRLKGDGWTVGGYLGWRLWPGVRFDAAIGRSAVSYDGTSGTAQASFPGHRWLASGGLTGLYRTQWLHFEPSARVYAIWERDDSYVDSLGTPQAENSFSTGRASAGAKVTYPIAWGGMTTLSPYVGLYADYYFSSDNAALLLPAQFVQGWAARTTAGVSYNAVGGARVMIGGELGGLGSQSFTTWSVRGRASVPF